MTQYRVVFKDDDHWYSILVNAPNPDLAVRKAEDRLPAGRRILPRWVPGFGYTPLVFEE